MKRIVLSLLAVGSLCSAQVYDESGGLVVMEIENTTSPLGLWQQQNSLSGYSGSGYLQFLGNTFENGPATSPLEFEFKINQAGLYYLHMHCAKETHDGRTDVANDCYVRVEGDYTAGPGPHTSHGDNASLALLQSDTKYFGGATDAWKWENGQNSSGGNGNLDPGGSNNKRVAVYDFKAGETYKLVVSGRSKFFRINRLVFRHTATSSGTAENLSTPESSTTGGGGGLSYVYDATSDFPDTTSGDIDYYVDNGNDALAIAANIVANRTGFARATRTFDGATGTYDVTITTMTEEDGESTYRLLVDGVQVRTFTNPFVYDPPTSPLDLQPHTHTWPGISIPNGATIAIESNADSNDQVSEAGDGNPPWAWARGRWQQIELTTSSSPVDPPAGRIAYVADGNSPDPDDIGANAVVFGLLGETGLQDRLVHFSHSCDLVKASNISAADELRRQNYLHQTAGEGIGFYGPFPNLTDYYNCRTEQTAAVNDLRDAINASTAADPLWIIEAGEPDIIGYALDAATPSKRAFVHVVSHHPANDDSGDFYTWAQILAFGVTEHQIGDQNVGLQVLISTGLWDWAEGHSNPAIVWILDQLKYAEADGVVGFQDNKYDCSDAGMIYWWLTGANAGGDNNSTPVEIKDMLLYEPGSGVVDVLRPVGHWKLDEGSGTVAADSSDFGRNGTLLNGVSWGSDATRGTYAQFDGTNDRISTPFQYALSAGDDFTWAWWANQGPGNSTGAIMVGNRYPEGAPNENFEFIKLMAHEAQFANTESAGSIEKYNYTDLPTNEWHHYAMVKTGNSYQWYVDGVAQGAPETFTYSESSTIPFLIGGDDDGSGTKVNEHFEGCLDDVVLYQRALTASDIIDVQNGIYFPAAPAIEVLAGWDAWDSPTAPTATVTATNVTATATASATGGSWATGESDSRGSSKDTTWGTFAGPAAASAVTTGSDGNLTLTNGKTDGEITFTINNNGTTDLVLDSFNFDAVAFRPNAARAYQLEVLSGDITNGIVFTSADDAITHLGGGLKTDDLDPETHDQHDDIDIDLTGLGDSTLEAGGTVVFQLAFSSGTGSGGGHHLFVDNVAVTHSVTTTPVSAPLVNAGLDASIILPVDQANLTGTATDDGTIMSTVWTQESGPNTAMLSGENTLNLTASGLIEGAYVFRLTATDDESNSSFDEVTVNVLPVGSGVGTITGELKKWHKVTISWNGPSTSETAATNPFSDYRLNVTFSHAGSGKSYTVPGYFAADGNAAETSAASGNVWRAHFAPDEEGEWSYAASFRTGSDVAVSTFAGAGTSAGILDGDSGVFTIGATDKSGRDLRGKGRLQYVGKHHLQFAETGEYFLKAGADAPENFLAYDDIDDTPNDQDDQPNLRKSWGAHVGDYDAASASAFTWQGGKGTEILGAVRYLSQKGVNVFSFLTFNVDGDDDNVFPHRLKSSVAAYEAVSDNARWAHANGVYHDRFDVSKMEQWGRVFEYGTQQGMYLHFKTQETENDDRMDGGALGRERKLYYRELVARYGYNLALNWNLGEENTNSTSQQQDFAQWFYDNDPYRHNVVLHTYPNSKDTVYTPLLGAASELTGLSLQTNQAAFTNVFRDTLDWVQDSASALKPWVVACDEPGDAQHALRPAGDTGNSWTDGRKNALWGNVMAGGAGVEFYFGYGHAHSDLTCQDYASRDGFWDYCRHLLEFFSVNQVPFQDMTNANSLVSGAGDNANRCLAKTGEAYVVQLYNGGSHTLNLSAATGEFEVWWFDPRNGGALQQGSVTSVTGGSTVSLGSAPSASTLDWVVYVTNGTGGGTTSGVMSGLPSDADVRDDFAIANLTADNLVPGRSGSSGGLNRSTQFVFQLPDLGLVDDPFLSATLGFNVETVSATPPGVDLYGLGKRPTGEVLVGDYYGETATPDPTDATLIQSNILTGSTGTGFKNSSAGTALAAYLNAQYDGGNGVGQYVFLRLSVNEPITGLLRHFVTSADAAGTDGPRISYTALAPQDFDAWLAGFTFPPGADLSPGGDADGDGLSTWTEYLFGLDPSDPSSVSPITGGLSKSAGTFSYTRRNTSLTGFADYQIWTTDDLQIWTRDFAAVQTVDGEDEIQLVTVTLTGHPLSDSKLFVQVVVE